MKRLLYRSFLLLFFTHSFTFAQNISPSVYSLNAALKTAIAELKKIEAELDQTKSLLGNSYDPCKTELLRARKKYTDWFIEHIGDFENTLPNTKELNEKFDRIKNIEVNVNPVEGNTATNVPVSLSTLANFIKIYNSRASACSQSPEKLALLEEQMQDPTLNTLGISSLQIPKVLELFTPFLNKKQSETPFSYKIKLEKNGCKIAIFIEVEVSTKTNPHHLYYKDILIDDAGNLSSHLDTESFNAWEFYTRNSLTVSDQAGDGFSRYFEFLKNIPQACLAGIAPLDTEIMNYSSVYNSGPFISYDDWLTKYKKLKELDLSQLNIYKRIEEPKPPQVVEAPSAPTHREPLIPNGLYISTKHKWRRIEITGNDIRYSFNGRNSHTTLTPLDNLGSVCFTINKKACYVWSYDIRTQCFEFVLDGFFSVKYDQMCRVVIH